MVPRLTTSKALSADGNPSFVTIVKVARVLGLRIRFVPAA
jgi:DNA-binding phage protein